MDIKKLNDDDKLKLCRTYFKGGFALLPFLWLVNVFWFFNEAFVRKPQYDQQKSIRKYVILSGIGSLFWIIVIVTWQIIFQTNRVSWGAVGDYMSFVFPRGYA